MDNTEDTCPLCQLPRYNQHNKPAAWFYYFPIIPTLKRNWKYCPKWAENCYYPYGGRENVEEGIMHDIFDTPNWRKHPELKHVGNIGLITNADGVSFQISANYSMSPAMAMVANLPPHERYPILLFHYYTTLIF